MLATKFERDSESLSHLSLVEKYFRRKKTGENVQPEELSNSRNGFGHDDNEGENVDDEKHCKTLSGLHR